MNDLKLLYFSENEEKEKKKKRVTREKEEDDEEDQNESQFFNMASKALKKLKRRTSMNTTETSNPQPESNLQQKIFKSPKAAKPLQILVSLIFALAITLVRELRHKVG